ncbi:ubiquinol-cytochrome c reductase iron-sulfur subunit [Haliangium sp.]|uniref:QcrA and Rieske domain-containing protein n=1 Tax=Haliangium sp. TaxID=2663208 RepID=UPI003D146BEF
MSNDPKRTDRRDFVTTALRLGMAGGLVAGYGTCAAVAGRYLFPPSRRATAWLYVARSRDIGDSAFEYTSPAGETVAIARQGPGEGADAFIALSNTCPHLGCKVYWQGAENRFFCPCHNGVFDPQGKGIGGPPGKAGQSLARFPLEVDRGLLYIGVSVDTAAAATDVDTGAGSDLVAADDERVSAAECAPDPTREREG